MQSGYRLALTLSAAFVLFVYKGLTIAPLAPLPILLGWALETATLFSLWALSEGAARSRSRAVRTAAAALFQLALPLLLVSSLAHTYFFESAAERRFSLLEVDLASLRFFFTSVLPARGTLLLTALLLAVYLLALPITRLTLPMRRGRVALALLGGWLLLALLLWRVPRVPSPLADLGADLWEQLHTSELSVERTKPARYAPRLLDKSETRLEGAEPAFDKVLVFVMETMTSEVLRAQQQALAQTSFVHAARAHAHSYENYFATNQDSRTGMLSMLGSRFIPYEAYTEQGRDHYLRLGQQSSLVDHMRRLGFKSAFAVSQQEVELVVGDLPWDEQIHLAEGETRELGKRFLCFVPYEFEHSCEDRALLPRVLAFIDEHPRVFLYQEFIWGHASEYNEASGKSNAEYYSAYLDAVVSHLKHTGALDRTLIVLTSDHGFRDKGLQSERAVYHLPLLFFAPRFAREQHGQLLSHLDFKELLLHHLLPGHPAPPAAPFVFAIGPTGTSFLTVLADPGQLLLMKVRAGAGSLLYAQGLPDPRGSAAEFLRLYQDYLGYFGEQVERNAR